MLYEIQCDKFAEKINGEFVPRGVIRFREGLNTVLGDKKAENSIGKSTFLLAVDFCFGGDDYVNIEKNNVVTFVKHHVIKFAFKFGDVIERYSRSTINPTEVMVCDANYKETGRVMSIKDFQTHLFHAYQIETAENSFRSIVGRFARVYGRDNYNEQEPLEYGDEKVASAIKALEQLYGVYNLVEEHEDFYGKKKKRKDVRKAATDLGEITTIATTKKQVKDNEKEIDQLRKELEELTMKQDKAVAEQDTEHLDQAAQIKGKISTLRRRRSRLVSQLNAVKANLEGSLSPTSEDIIDLQEYFPEVDILKLESIEKFHKKMQNILTGEMSEEVARLEMLISVATQELKKLEEEQRRLGVPTNVSKKFLEQVVELERKIRFLTAQNKGYEETKTLETETKDAKEKLLVARRAQLEKVQNIINQEMVRLNDFIYDGETYAPVIEFSDTNTGNPKYKLRCDWNTGTGENYKNLIIFDLSILRTTELPVLVHDSLVFKNIADLPIDKIMKLYMQSSKQIFISFDKQEAFDEYTSTTVKDTKVIELYGGGGELFGWSWAKKKKETKN